MTCSSDNANFTTGVKLSRVSEKPGWSRELMNPPMNTQEGDLMPTWSLNINEIHQNAWRSKGDKGKFTWLQESFIREGYISSVLGVFIKWENGTKVHSGSSMSRTSLRSRSISSEDKG